jgi:pimeloyl-ACP methyl ester carboxylesterase
MRRLGAPPPPPDAPPAYTAFADFMALIGANFRPRTQPLPRFSDAALGNLTMPVLAILGARDAMLDSFGTRARLAIHLPHADVRWLPDAGHFLIGHGFAIDAFLAKALRS